MDLDELKLPLDEIRAFCERWRVVEFAVFGSALRADFGPDSDLDVLVEFSPDTERGLFDRVEMQLELQSILGREVDLVTKSALELSHNWIRKEAILSTAQLLDLQDKG
jgi:uncharacterized protein